MKVVVVCMVVVVVCMVEYGDGTVMVRWWYGEDSDAHLN